MVEQVLIIKHHLSAVIDIRSFDLSMISVIQIPALNNTITQHLASTDNHTILCQFSRQITKVLFCLVRPYQINVMFHRLFTFIG